jgi:putative DNA primase/helicase
VLVHCHAGCDQEQVIATLRSRGLWRENGPRRFIRSTPRAAATSKPDRDDAKRTEIALAIWQAAMPAAGTLVETYLASRGLHLQPPPTLRFHAGLPHPSGGIWPAMVALVTRGSDDTPLAVHRTFLSSDSGGNPIGIHRTFLAREGNGKAPVEPAKMMLGPCRGGAVRLGPIGDQLMIAEGIETALSAMQATGQAAWAALSISGLRTLGLPDAVREVIVLADGDEPGEAAARDAALRWKREGRYVRIARPPRGFDFNDVLLGRTFCHAEDAA